MIYQHEIREKRIEYIGPRPGFPEPSRKLSKLMDTYLTDRRLSTKLAVVNLWYPSHYAHAPRIVIPCSNTAGVPYFQARDMSGKAKLRYASPPASRDDSVAVVWPENKARGTVVVEGPMDALAAADEGFLGIALMGNVPNAEVLDHLVSLARSFEPVLIVPDIDALSLGPLVLCAMAQEGIGGVILSPQAKDLAAMTPKERKRFLWV